MNCLFVMDPIESIHVFEDTTLVLMLEAQRRGYGVDTCRIEDLSNESGVGRARAWPVEVRRVEGDHFTKGEQRSRPLADYELIFMRTDPPVDMAYLHATYILEACPPTTLVVNRPETLRACNEKLYALQFPHLMPPTLVSSNLDELLTFCEQQGGEVVLKPIEGRGGEGVFFLRRSDRNHRVILETMTGFGARYVMAQRYVPDILTTGDKRLIVVRGEPLGAVARHPRPGDFRSNVHIGGSVTQTEVDARDREICSALKDDLVRRGVIFAGIDVIGGYLTEVNNTSPTLVQEITALNGLHLERDILDAAEEALREVGVSASSLV